MHIMHSSMINMHDANRSPSEVIRSARSVKNLSQQAFGQILGKSQGVISRYEHGLVDPPAEILMQCMHILAPSTSSPPAGLEPAITGVRQALGALERALEVLQHASVSGRDMPTNDVSHSPLVGEGSHS